MNKLCPVPALSLLIHASYSVIKPSNVKTPSFFFKSLVAKPSFASELSLAYSAQADCRCQWLAVSAHYKTHCVFRIVNDTAKASVQQDQLLTKLSLNHRGV